MAPQDSSGMLRVVTQRLSSTPVKQLPHVTPCLATIIAQHGRALATLSKDGKFASETESAVTVHKLKTQLSALLQDKNPEARFAAVILIRSTVETGGWNVLQGVGAWVRGLIGILGKPDPPTTKKLCIIALTRIFLLTHEHQSLVREITTPSLPGFITACFNMTKNSPLAQAASEHCAQRPLLLSILHALCELIAMHPTLFRPFVSQIHSLTYPLIAPTPSNANIGSDPTFTSPSVSECARHLFVLLHVTGPKNTAAEEWARSLDAVMKSAQRTADRVFRSLIEDWKSPSIGSYDVTNLNAVEDVVSDQAPSPLALPAWAGIHAGIERLEGLLHALQAFLATTTAATVTLPVGNILNLVDRILSIRPPGTGRNPRFKPEIGRDEREGLWVGLPRLQISALNVCSLMISRMGQSSAAVAGTILDQLLWILESQNGNDNFRKAAYKLASQILSMSGLSLPRFYAISLSRCIRMCCEDLLPSAEPQLQGGQASLSDPTKAANRVTSSKNADTYLKAANNTVDLSVTSTSVNQAAREVLRLALRNLPDDFLPFSLRSQIDRTSIFTNDRKVMLASVMNPIAKRGGQKNTKSILPLLARAHPGALQVEALLRPQMPPIQSRRSDERDVESDEEGDIYMHNHPQIHESNGFYHGLAGTSTNAKGEGNTVSGHSDIQMEATSGATQARSAGIGPTMVSKITPTGLQGPIFTLSNPSKKRDREEKLHTDTEDLAEGGSTEQVEIKAVSKRTRLGLDETQTESPLEQAPINRAPIDTGGIGQPANEIPALDSAPVSSRQSNIQQEYSDESDFEMPILNLDPDSDEEEEEEEEEENE